jgi:hypothetical protein
MPVLLDVMYCALVSHTKVSCNAPLLQYFMMFVMSFVGGGFAATHRKYAEVRVSSFRAPCIVCIILTVAMSLRT